MVAQSNGWRYFGHVIPEAGDLDIASYIDGLAARGRYHFTTAEAVAALGSSPVAARAAIRRQGEKGRVAMPFRTFHVIVPPEYRALGCLPADQFVPQLMEHLGQVYYAGLLTAASLHGAAHQAPMVFQVVVAQNRAEIRCGRVRVEFAARANVGDVPTIERNTLRGVLRVSTPEATAFDLTGYPSRAGGLSNVATVLAELAESMDAARLRAEADRSPLPWAQRLGYLLERVGALPLAAPLAEYVSKKAKEYVPLRTRKPVARASRAPRWRLLVNEEVEAESATAGGSAARSSR
jgi:predicted transcriptional regulator of viral defense system